MRQYSAISRILIVIVTPKKIQFTNPVALLLGYSFLFFFTFNAAVKNNKYSDKVSFAKVKRSPKGIKVGFLGYSREFFFFCCDSVKPEKGTQTDETRFSYVGDR